MYNNNVKNNLFIIHTINFPIHKNWLIFEFFKHILYIWTYPENILNEKECDTTEQNVYMYIIWMSGILWTT